MPLRLYDKGWWDTFTTFTTVHKGKIVSFHDHLNEQNADIPFTKEIEELKLCFLDCLVSCKNNEL